MCGKVSVVRCSARVAHLPQVYVHPRIAIHQPPIVRVAVLELDKHRVVLSGPQERKRQLGSAAQQQGKGWSAVGKGGESYQVGNKTQRSCQGSAGLARGYHDRKGARFSHPCVRRRSRFALPPTMYVHCTVVGLPRSFCGWTKSIIFAVPLMTMTRRRSRCVVPAVALLGMVSVSMAQDLTVSVRMRRGEMFVDGGNEP